jgi:hypothetical protein
MNHLTIQNSLAQNGVLKPFLNDAESTKVVNQSTSIGLAISFSGGEKADI